MNMLYVFWQNPENRRWFPVGILSRERDVFRFVYTRGAQEANGFIPFGRMTDLNKRYEAKDLFPLFANRLLSTKRPEYHQFIQWIAAEQQATDPLVILGRTGGQRATDSLVVYPKPEPNERNQFDLIFLCHGVSHLPTEAVDRIESLKPGEILFPMLDVQNPHDGNAVAIRTNDPPCFVGYVPRFFAKDLRKCIEWTHREDVHLNVARVNDDAPLQFRLLCRFTSPWPTDFKPWDDPEYQPLVEVSTRLGAFETSMSE